MAACLHFFSQTPINLAKIKLGKAKKAIFGCGCYALHLQFPLVYRCFRYDNIHPVRLQGLLRKKSYKIYNKRRVLTEIRSPCGGGQYDKLYLTVNCVNTAQITGRGKNRSREAVTTDMPLEIVRNDITNMRVDAIVNAANSGLQRGGGVCGAIFAAAGATELERECAKIGGCTTGGAVLTGGGKLPAKFIIHTVGPVWQGGQQGEEEKLRSCYRNSLELAVSRGFESVAFPLISSGIYGYPKDQALNVAVSEIGSFLLEHDIDVFLVVFDRDSYRLGEARQRSIQAFIDDAYAKARERERSSRLAELAFQLTQERETSARKEAKAAPCASPKAPPFFQPKAGRKPEPEGEEEEADAAPLSAPSALERFIERASESFSQALLRLIDERGLTDPQVYQRANLDRRLFSKIRGNPQYRPSKNTALALAVALRLNLDQTQDLLRRAGYALSPSSRFDLIVEYFIREENYNIFEINEALFAFDESLLGA